MPAEKIRALLATSRIANVPSVVSNVWLGVAAAALCNGRGEMAISISQVILLSVTGVLLYISGNFFNDWMDFDWDVKHRPERALPRKLFVRNDYAWMAMILANLAILLSLQVSGASAGIVIVILISIGIYTWSHKKTPWSVIPMGLCRALLVLLGASIFAINASAIFAALGLLSYIAGLSLNARYESLAEPPRLARIMARGMFFLTALLVCAAAFRLPHFPWICLLGLLPFSAWMLLCFMKWRRPIPHFVSRLLAGIPLVDWILLLPIAAVGSGNATLACWIVPPLAFIAALLLQRLAPAT